MLSGGPEMRWRVSMMGDLEILFITSIHVSAEKILYTSGLGTARYENCTTRRIRIYLHNTGVVKRSEEAREMNGDSKPSKIRAHMN